MAWPFFEVGNFRCAPPPPSIPKAWTELTPKGHCGDWLYSSNGSAVNTTDWPTPATCALQCTTLYPGSTHFYLKNEQLCGCSAANPNEGCSSIVPDDSIQAFAVTAWHRPSLPDLKMFSGASNNPGVDAGSGSRNAAVSACALACSSRGRQPTIQPRTRWERFVPLGFR